MAGIELSNGMAYNANPPGRVRFPFDPDPGSKSLPQCISLDDLIAKMPKGRDSVSVVNFTRGCFNLNTKTKKLNLYDQIDIMIHTGGSTESYAVKEADIAWQANESLSPYDGLYLIIADRLTQAIFGDVYVLREDMYPAWPTLTNPVIIGSFRFHSNVDRPGIQGLSIRNDDVTIDGKYIYEMSPGLQAILVGQTKNALKLSTSEKTFTIASSMRFVTWQPITIVGQTVDYNVPDRREYTIDSGTWNWNKGSAVSYEGFYYIIADVGSESNVLHITTASMFIPSGTAYMIGSFYYNEVSGQITGITYPGDLMIDGVPIWGGGDQTVSEITSSRSWTVPSGCTKIDAFLVGGGGAGGGNEGGGGGGGYTTLLLNIPVTPGETLTMQVGAGGTAVSGADGGNGGATKIQRGATTIAEAAGGYGGGDESGGAGGSGGGAGQGGSGTTGGAGGSDGSDGGAGSLGITGGAGQGTTTKCPFNDVLYAGGGGGARRYGSSNGGAGGGGSSSTSEGNGEAGAVNTGGGGGGCWNIGVSAMAGNGGSGIIILRYAT